MIRFTGFAVLLFSASLVSAQVGFNNPAPDPSAIIDLTATDKGLLIPRMTTAQREAMAVSQTPAQALMVYDVTLKQFCFYDGTRWFTLNTWKQEAGQAVANFPGAVEVDGTLLVNGAMSATGLVRGSNYGLNEHGNGPVPAGGIIMWSGAITAIPTGWALCDGTAPTPDLRNRFIVGAGSTYPQRGVGGQDRVTLGMTNIPRHNHPVSDPGHNHDNGDYKYLLKRSGTSTVGSTDGNGATEPNVVESAEVWRSTTGITVGNAGGNASGATDSFDNKPLYFALAYIMKLP